MIKNVIFDLGKVLIDFNPEKYLQRFKLTTEQIDIIMHRCFETDLWNDSDRGIYTYRQIANILAAEFPELSPLVHRIFGDEFFSIFAELPDGIHLLSKCVQKGYSCYYLSNFCDEGFRYVRRKFDFFNLFKGGIASYEIHSIKPETRIYQTFLEKFGLKAEECIFIDDSEDNVDAADDLGFHGIQYISLEQTRRDFYAIINLETKRNLVMNYEKAHRKLSDCNQLQVLDYYEQIDDEHKNLLLNEILNTDFSVLQLAKSSKQNSRGRITPIPAMTLSEIETDRERFEQIGMQAIKENKVAAVLLAGGMGTRLGSDAPKGMYNIGITKPVYIFERIVANLMDIVRQTGTNIHLFIMTSDKNHAATTRFFAEQNYFGYNKSFIHFFKQEMAPASDYDGNALLEQKWKLATSPNGNGGWFQSMIGSGMLDILKKEKIEFLNVFAVDNVLQRIADPVFVGAVIDKNYTGGSKVIRKVSPEEKVGVMCLENGHPSIVEYYELTEDMRYQTDENGEYAYNFGVILNYLFRVDALEKIAQNNLPYHLAEKKIACLDEQGNAITPAEPNGYKYEIFILDMIYMLDTCLPFEVVREKEFAPIKNKTGVDSVESARELLKKNQIEL